MPIAPDTDAVKAYIGSSASFTDDEIATELAAETLAQAHACTIPGEAGDQYPADLAKALCRRVSRALNMRYKPLGYEPGLEGGLSWISARDSEITRLEAPFRKLVIG